MEAGGVELFCDIEGLVVWEACCGDEYCFGWFYLVSWGVSCFFALFYLVGECCW